MTFTLNTDGGSRGNPGPAGCGFVLAHDGREAYAGGWFIGTTTNNVAEYSALIWGLENARAQGVDTLQVYADSELMIKQMRGEYKVKSADLKPLFARARELANQFADISFSHVRRAQNARADELANAAMDAKGPAGTYLVAFDGKPAGKTAGLPSNAPAEQLRFIVPADAAPTVLVGITGCIAAYKACEVVRGLQKAGCDVKVVMTEHATEFVGPVTFRALTNHEVAVGLFDEPGAPIHHISLAKEADAFCIAPATANVIAKIARGQADDLLTTTALASKAPLIVAPAMNADMLADAATQENLRELQARGVRIVGPGNGYLACGAEGAGRLEEPAVIVEAVLEELARAQDMAGLKVLVTAGPTHEPIDPVRYIGNRSSGLQGYAIAAEAAARGAQVTLVSGPTSLACPRGVTRVDVTCAREMLAAAEAAFADADIAVFVAAVADWRPAEVREHKIKHDGGDLDIHLVPNPDIAATLGAKKESRVVVAFAAETGDPREAARKKLVAKNADLVVANNVAEPGAGMGTEGNHVWLVSAEGEREVPAAPKRVIARAILDCAVGLRVGSADK